MVVGFDPQYVSGEDRSLPSIKDDIPVLLMLRRCDDDMKTYSSLFNVRITGNLVQDCCPGHLHLINK